MTAACNCFIVGFVTGGHGSCEEGFTAATSRYGPLQEANSGQAASAVWQSSEVADR